MEKSNKGLFVIIILLIVVVLGLGGYIIYDKVLINEEKQDDLKQDEAVENNELSKNELETLYKIIGIDLSSDKQIYNGLNAVLLNQNGLISNFNKDDKADLIKLYVHINNLSDNNVQEYCNQQYDGSCVAINEEVYNEVAKKYNITDGFTELYNDEKNGSYEIYNGIVIYGISGGGGGPISKISHNIEISYEDEQVILTDNSTFYDTEGNIGVILDKENEKITGQITVYKFNKTNGIYSLYSIENI